MTDEKPVTAPPASFFQRVAGSWAKFKARYNRAYWLLLQSWYLFWNPHAFLNIRQGINLPKIGECTLRGYSAMVHTYPLIPIAFVLSTLTHYGWMSEQTLGAWMLVALVVVLIVVAEDAPGQFAFAVLLGLVAVVTSIWALEKSGVDVWSYVLGFVGFTTPRMSAGWPVALALVLAVYHLFLYVRAGVYKLHIQGNQYVPVVVRRNPALSSETHVLMTDVPDWFEVLMSGSVTMQIASRFDTVGTVDERESNLAKLQVAFKLENAVGVFHVKEFVLAEGAVKEVSQRTPPQTLPGG